jgi:elongator complex protein 1
MRRTCVRQSLHSCKATSSLRLVEWYVSVFVNMTVKFTDGLAFCQVTLHNTPELLTEIIHPAALDSRTQIAEDLNEMREQLRKQLARIRELRIKKVEEPGEPKPLLFHVTIVNLHCPDAFYGTQDDNVDLHNVDVMTDISMAPTAFTRYTQAPSTMSKSSK